MTLYSTNCPRCNVLKSKLDEKNISYEICSDTTKMSELGIEYLPMLDTGKELLNFKDALKFLNQEAE